MSAGYKSFITNLLDFLIHQQLETQLDRSLTLDKTTGKDKCLLPGEQG